MCEPAFVARLKHVKGSWQTRDTVTAAVISTTMIINVPHVDDTGQLVTSGTALQPGACGHVRMLVRGYRR